MRWTVSFVCGLRIPCGVALALSNRRYAACVLAQSPHASLIGEPGDFARCPAVLLSSHEYRRQTERRRMIGPTLDRPERPRAVGRYGRRASRPVAGAFVPYRYV